MARRKVKNGERSPWGQCLTNHKAERRRPFGTGLVRHCPQGLLLPFFTFLRATFFCPFRLSLAPTICPWVSQDEPDLGCKQSVFCSKISGTKQKSGPRNSLQSCVWRNKLYIPLITFTWAGLRTTVFPAANRGEIFHANIING